MIADKRIINQIKYFFVLCFWN